MIPKIIHYCWFGRGKKSDLIENCIKSWRIFCPDYEIIEWNEDNFDVNNSIPYVKKAYSRKEYAFVSDYVRVKVLNDFGGIYLDTDVELIKNLDSLLENKAFLGFADDKNVGTAVIGGEKNNIFFIDFLNSYNNMVSGVGNNGIANNILYGYGLEKTFNKDITYTLNKFLKIYPKYYFEPIDYKNKKKTPYENKKIYLHKESYSIHYSNLSWITWKMWTIHYIGTFLEILGIRKFIKLILIKIGFLDPKKYGYE